MPGRFAETLDSCPHRTTEFFFHSCRLRRQPRHFFPGKNPDLGLGRAPMPGRWRGRGFYAGQECGALGIEAVGQARTHWASHAPAWRGAYSACAARLVPVGTSSACSARLVPAQHCACSARLVKCLLGTFS